MSGYYGTETIATVFNALGLAVLMITFSHIAKAQIQFEEDFGYTSNNQSARFSLNSGSTLNEDLEHFGSKGDLTSTTQTVSEREIFQLEVVEESMLKSLQDKFMEQFTQ